MADDSLIEKTDKLYIDEPTVVSFANFEMGWFIQRWQARLRFLKQQVHQDRTFILFTHTQWHCLVDDFVSYTISLPKEFYDLKLETDCYEAPFPNAPAGTLTSPKVYASLINYMRKFYNPDKAIEIWPPRGCNFAAVDRLPQVFRKYVTPRLETEKPIITVFPRGRARAPERNVPEFVWKEVVDKLREDFMVVLGGTTSGSFLANYKGDSIINLISYEKEDKMALLIQYLSNSTCSVSSQSGPTHLSLLCACPSYIIGHEKDRHTKWENRLDTVCSFRYVKDYRAIDAATIIYDIADFLSFMERNMPRFVKEESLDINTVDRDMDDPMPRPSLRTLRGKKDLVGVEIGTDTGVNAENMLQNLDIKTLYLVDPYEGIDGLGCNNSAEQNESCEKEAKERLHPYEDRIVKIKATSEDAVSQIPDDLDFVYIDGNHRYDFVKKDILLYSPKVKEGGLVAGHDYDYYEVQNAVNELIKTGFVRRTSDGPKENTYLDWWTIKADTGYDEVIDQDKAILDNLLRAKQ